MEWKDVTPEQPIRQGDLLAKLDREQPQNNSYILMLTADCDIDKKKHGSAYAALQVLDAKSYIKQIWAEKNLEDCRDNELSSLYDLFNKIIKGTGRNAIGVESIKNWIFRASPVTIFNSLGIEDGSERKKFERCIAKLKPLVAECTGVNTVYDLLLQFYMARDDVSLDVASSNIFKNFCNKFSSPPSDIFILTSMPEEQWNNYGPFIVLLRDVLAIKKTEVTFSMEESKELGGYLRVGRLEPTFKYALTQQFASLYSKIGLPNEYDEKKKLIVKSIKF